MSSAHGIGISLPRRILIKRGAAFDVDRLLKALSLGERCALFCDQTSLKVVGSKVRDDISGSFVADLIDAVSTDIESVRKLADAARRYDFCLAIGGGKTIDICKYAAFLAGKPWVSFPTIPSHDGIVSSRASLEESGKRISADAEEPAAIIADLDILHDAPYRYIAAGAGDCISNISAVEDWKLANKSNKEKYHEVIAGLAVMAAHTVMLHAHEIAERTYHGLEMLVWSLICSGFAMNLQGSSRPASGSEHNFSHALDVLGSTALHGEQVALGTIISVYLQGGEWQKIKDVMRVLRLPTTARELGVSDDTAVKALARAKDIRERHTILNETNIDERKACQILADVGII